MDTKRHEFEASCGSIVRNGERRFRSALLSARIAQLGRGLGLIEHCQQSSALFLVDSCSFVSIRG